MRFPLALALLFLPLLAHAQTYPPPSLPLSGSEVVPCIQGGAYKSCTSANIGATAGGGVTSVTAGAGLSGGGTGAVTLTNSSASVTGAIKSNGSGTYTQAGAADLIDGTSGSGAIVLGNNSTITNLFALGTVTTALTSSGAQCLEANASGQIIGTGAVCGGSGSVPGGSSTQFQYNAAGAFGGTTGLTWTSGSSTWAASSAVTMTLPDTSSWVTGGLTFATTKTVTLPDTGTLKNTADTFVKVVTTQNSSPSNGTPAFTWSSSNASGFGCITSNAANGFMLGSTSSVGGGCGTTGVLQWTTSANSLLFPGGFLNENTATFKDSTGATTILTVSFPGAVPTVTVPTAGVLDLGSAGLSGSVSSHQLNIGNGTNGDGSGILNVATASVPTAINGPSVSGLAVNAWSTTAFNIGQPLKVMGGGSTSQLVTIPTNSAMIGFGGYANEGMLLSGAPNAAFLNNYMDPSSYYNLAHQIAILSSVNSAPYIVAGVEPGQSDNQAFEVGNVRSCSQMLGCVAQAYILDAVFPAGAVKGWVIDTPGTGYTQATTTATGSWTGCAVNPSALTVKVNDTTGQVTYLAATSSGRGCVSGTVTINSSGSGTGATAHPVFVTGTTDQSVGPTLLWNQGFAQVTGAGSQMGLGQCDITRARCLRLGSSTNTGAVWNFGAATQPVLSTGGFVEFDTATGTVFTGGEQLSDAGSGVLQITACTGGAGNDCTSTSTASALKTGSVITTAVTVSTLPASPTDGQRAFVTDSTVAAATNFGVTVTGGGTNHVPVYWDAGASAWRIG